MLRLGEKQQLEIVKKVDFGVYLAEEGMGQEERVLLPAKQVPEGSKVGDILEVFLYRDSQDRLIATTRQPALVLGQTAELTVVQTGRIGAFLDWGLEKDLLLPFKEQKKKVNTGDKVLVSLYIDKSKRLCATMNVYPNLRTDSPYQKDDRVRGRVYEISGNFGAFAIYPISSELDIIILIIFSNHKIYWRFIFYHGSIVSVPLGAALKISRK